jgi:hypothetical protein
MAKAVRRLVMGEVDKTARRLLREMGYQAEDNPTLDVLPREAAENLDLDPGTPDGTPEYEAALNHLVALGEIEPNADPTLSEHGLYRLTRKGLIRARETRWAR